MEVLSGPSRRLFLVWTLVIQLVLYGSVVFTAEGIKSCKLLYDSKSDWKVLSRLEPLANKNFTVETMEQGESYTYVFQLCGDAGGVPGAGVVQVDKGTEKKTTVIGVYNATQAIGANDWVMLIYRNGDAYNAHCSKEKRKAFVMISCNRKVDMWVLSSGCLPHWRFPLPAADCRSQRYGAVPQLRLLGGSWQPDSGWV
ncbi:putative cation-dependent mannose-6-phosphate receptor isoform 3 [Scophthalmus maximus]|uniref:Putative cation-dependent mannose-6-phosphate receptor isoform 3 n=1 Tax=Scophthalmus maximus TaxID=52904 RepID=A0A2U9AXT3_SCOMX|nr:putative cation-dependent mannose-6-phosphate receptor isoform 3 [Scophthalmus maximus]